MLDVLDVVLLVNYILLKIQFKLKIRLGDIVIGNKTLIGFFNEI